MLTSIWFLALACWVVGVPLTLILLGWAYSRHADARAVRSPDGDAVELEQMMQEPSV